VDIVPLISLASTGYFLIYFCVFQPGIGESDIGCTSSRHDPLFGIDFIFMNFILYILHDLLARGFIVFVTTCLYSSDLGFRI
jgi:hypothetical protein